MMESLHLSPVLMTLCLLISLRTAVQSERFETKGRIPTDLKKVSWNTFLELIVFWGTILALRKLVYYIPFDGMIQTKTTVWWIEKTGSSYLFIFLFMALMMVLRGMIGRSKQPGKGGRPVYFYEIVVIFGPIAIIFLGMVSGVIVGGNFFLLIYSYITQLLLSLKLTCSGTYIGLFTSFLLAYYITDGPQIFKVLQGIDKKRKKEKTKSNALWIPVLLLITGIFTYLRIPSGASTWMNQLLGELREIRTHQQERAFDDLLDAANYMRDGVKKSRALGEIAVVIRNSGDIQRAKKILNQATNNIQRLQDRTLKFKAFRQLAFILKGTEDDSSAKQMFKKAIGAVQWIKDSNERVHALKVVIYDNWRTEDIKWAKDIFLWTIDATDIIDDDSMKAEIFKDVLRVISETTDIKWAEPIYRKIALAIAKTGDTQWAAVVASGIADEEIKNKALQQIQEKIGEQ